MYLKILKRDIKRKKTMNIIVLLFVILSAMFAASSLNNIVTVAGGIDYYLDKAGIPEYAIITSAGTSGEELAAKLGADPAAKRVRLEHALFDIVENVKEHEKGGSLASSNDILIFPIDNAQLNYFDENNDVIESVPKGKVYISTDLIEKSGYDVGDSFDITIGNVTVTLEYAGRVKDAALGSNFMGNPRFILNAEDFKTFTDDPSTKGYVTDLLYIDTDDIIAVVKLVADDPSISFNGDRSVIKMTYILELFTAGMVMAVSICLILISFVILRFTIGFTISEEFREIGVMKAIGLKNRHIRLLYLVKYLGIAVTGAVIGFFLSIPFGKLLIESATKNMYLGNDNSVLIGILACVAVVGIILLFCYGCTRRIKKLSPIDAVRSGQTGERFKKRGILNLGKSRLGFSGFMAANDVLSAKKQYGIMTAIFTLTLLLVMIFANIANTLQSDKLLFLFGTTRSDLYYDDLKTSTEIQTGNLTSDEACRKLEAELEDLGMPGKVHREEQYMTTVEYKGEKKNLLVQHCNSTKASEYVYEEGTAPQNAHEFATTDIVCDDLGFDIGDKVNITIDGKTEEYMLTAKFQSMNQLGSIIRLHEDVDMGGMKPTGSFGFQIDFDDHPNESTIKDRQKKLKEEWDNEQIMTVAEFVDDCTNSADTIAAFKDLILMITLVITVMIVVLMERSFIAKEKSEIALMKALGLKNRQIVKHHTLRFMIIGLLSGILAGVLCIPLTKLVADPIFKLMGCTNGLEYKIIPTEIFCIYPAILLAAVFISALLTSLYTKTVKASDTADIE